MNDPGPIPAFLVREVTPAEKAAATRAMGSYRVDKWKTPPMGMTAINRAIRRGRDTLPLLRASFRSRYNVKQIKAALVALEDSYYVKRVGAKYLPYHMEDKEDTRLRETGQWT